MHREYHPAELHASEGDAHPGDLRSLIVLTVVLGLLIGGDVLLGILGWRAPFGISPALIAAILGGARIVYGALEALAAGRIGADVALAQACVAALVLGEPFVAAEVVFIALVGELLEAVTFARARRAIHRLLDQTPRTARVRRDGQELEIPADRVVVGDVVLVRPGERSAVDGTVLAGRSVVDQAALTGEATPVDKGPGEAISAGAINQFGLLEVRAEKVGRETTLGQVGRLVAEAQHRKAPLERAADRYARWFLPVVEAVALLTLVAGHALGWPDVWHRTVAVLVVACPCALVLATPAAVMASMAWLARHGVVIKGGAALEHLAACDTFAFDKTGTLTLGRPELAGVVPLGGASEAEVLLLAAAAEQTSRHPLADVITREAAARGLAPLEAFDVVAHPGAGVFARCRAEGDDAPRAVMVGNRRLMVEHGLAPDEAVEAALNGLDARGETGLLVAVDGMIVGAIGVRDAVRREAHDVVHDLKHLKITEVAILTGDRAAAAAAVARRTHIKTVAAELLPADKARWIQQRQEDGRRVAMVGDGINDAPALARADVGIAIGGAGADLAAEAGDVVMLGDPLRVLPDLVKLSRKTVAIIRQNILGFAFGLNAGAMGAAALGILGPVPAAILHQCGSLLVLLNAMRLLGFGGWSQIWPVRRLCDAGRALQRWDDRIDPGLAFERLLRRWRLLAALALLSLLVLYATSGWTALAPDEVGLLRRFGRYRGRLEPGLHLRLPPPFEQVTRLKPFQVKALEISLIPAAMGAEDLSPLSPSPLTPASGAGGQGSALPQSRSEREPGVARAPHPQLLSPQTGRGELLTGDGHLVELVATVQYRLDPRSETLRAYAFGAFDADEALRPLAESAVRSVVVRRALDDVLTARRHEAERASAAELQRRASAYRLGLVIVAVSFQDVHPPLAVVDAYRDVSRAESERQTRRHEAETYRAERLAQARGRAAATVRAAEADRLGRVARAAGEADSFRARHEARAGFPALSDHRLYWETIAAALAGRPKVVLDPSPARRHLIVPDLPLGPLSPVVETLSEDTRRETRDKRQGMRED